jgi:iron-sulfur cluster assembly protein
MENKMSEQQEQTAVQEITITPDAVEEIKKIRAENQIPETHALRMGIKEGGCCGVSYVLGFEERSSEEDKIFQTNGLTVFVDAKSFLHLSGATLEFMTGPNGSGFKFSNPNDQNSCDCGDGGCGDGGCCG